MFLLVLKIGEVPPSLVVPFEWGATIKLDHNLLTGTLPTFLARVDQPNVTEIHLNDNRISGETCSFLRKSVRYPIIPQRKESIIGVI